jgi:signal transduction histidine kinase
MVETTDLCRSKAEQAGITISRELNMELPPARVDYDRLKSGIQRLINLLIEYCAVYQRGSVLVKSMAENDKIHLMLAVEGISFSNEKFEQIKHLFSMNNVNGLDLSEHDPDLVVTKGIIDLHGGQIRIENKSGRSSSFIISLPVYEPVYGFDLI